MSTPFDLSAVKVVGIDRDELDARMLQVEQANLRLFGYGAKGFSARSDVLPVLDIGGAAIHVPYHVVWAHEVVHGAEADPRFPTVASLSDAADLLTT